MKYADQSISSNTTRFYQISLSLMLFFYCVNQLIYPVFQKLEPSVNTIFNLLFLQICFLLSPLITAIFILEKKELQSAFRLYPVNKRICVNLAIIEMIIFPIIYLSAIISDFFLKKINFIFEHQLLEIIKSGHLWDSFFIVFTGIFIAPLAEEIVFRLTLFEFLHSRLRNQTMALIFTSLLFAVLHADPVRIPGLFMLGIVLQYVMIKYKSLLAPLFLHAAHNLLSFAVFYFFSNL